MCIVNMGKYARMARSVQILFKPGAYYESAAKMRCVSQNNLSPAYGLAAL